MPCIQIESPCPLDPAKGELQTQPSHIPTIHFYVPATFNPELIPKLAGLHEESYWFLHKIISLQICYKHSQTEWVNISQQTIRQFIHPRHAQLVQYILMANRVIECNGNYKQGSHSMGWRLAKPYRTDIKRIPVTKPTLVAKMLRHRIRYNDKPIPETQLDKIHQHILSWLRKVKIDIGRVYKIIEDMPEPVEKKLTPRKRCKMVKGYRKALNRVTVDQIADGDFDYTICKQGRIHTPITRLFTEARSCLSVGGKPLASIDIANSQLIFFTLLWLENQYNEQAADQDDSNLTPSACPVPSALPSPSCTTSALPTLASPPSLPLVVPPAAALPSSVPSTASSPSCTTSGSFVTLVMNGGIYQYMMQRYAQEYGEEISSRREFKRLFFQQVLYGDNDRFYASGTPLALLFQLEFPEVWEFILEQKRWSGRGNSGDAFKRLALRMQERESRYMIGQVCARLMEFHPEVPVVTVHDSILTPEEYLSTVRRVMVEEFARLGVSPALRVESCI